MENQKPNELWRVLKKFYGTKKNVEHNSTGRLPLNFQISLFTAYLQILKDAMELGKDSIFDPSQ
jgi:hypothetical protein